MQKRTVAVFCITAAVVIMLARIGLTDPAPDWSVLAGVNFSFGGEDPGTEPGGAPARR